MASSSGLEAPDSTPLAPLAQLSRIPQRTAFVDPFEIAPFSCVRKRKKQGIAILLDGIANSGWNEGSSGIYVVELKHNPLPLDAGDGVWEPSKEPVYGCVDGWHRVQVCILLFTKLPDSPFDPNFPWRAGPRLPEKVNISAVDTPSLFPGWPLDASSGYVSKVKVTILDGSFLEHNLVRFAMHLNFASKFVVVPSGYLDKISGGKRFLDSYCRAYQRAAGGSGPQEQFNPRAEYVKEMYDLHRLESKEAWDDYDITTFLNSTPGLLELWEEQSEVIPVVTEYVMRREVLKQLHKQSSKLQQDTEFACTWAAFVLILAQDMWTDKMTRTSGRTPAAGGPAKAETLYIVLHLLLDSYVLHKPAPPHPVPTEAPQPRLARDSLAEKLADAFVDNRRVREQKDALASLRELLFERYRPPRIPTPVFVRFTPDNDEVHAASHSPSPSGSRPYSPTRDRPSPPSIDPGLEEALAVFDSPKTPPAEGEQPREPEESSSESQHSSRSAFSASSSSSAIVPVAGTSDGPGAGQLFVPPQAAAGSQPDAAAPPLASSHDARGPAKKRRREESASSDEIRARDTPPRATQSGTNWPPPAAEEREPLTREEIARKKKRQAVGEQILREAQVTVDRYMLRPRVEARAKDADSDSSAQASAPVRKSRRTARAVQSYAFDDDITPANGTARSQLMRPLTRDHQFALNAIAVPDLMGSPELVREFFGTRKEAERPRRCRLDVDAWIGRPSETMMMCLMNLAISSLEESGFAVLQGVIPGKSTAGGESLRECVDNVLDHFLSLFSEASTHMCCAGTADEQAAWAPIKNSVEGEKGESKRYQTPRAAILQHLEASHSAVFAQKLLVDMCIANLVERLVVRGKGEAYSLPKSGSRLLLSAPGCSGQCTHTDFADRSDRTSGVPVDDPSYFAIATGMRGADLTVIPSSHKLASRLESVLCRPSRESNATLADAISDLATPKDVHIPCYSLFIGRGDLVHAGTKLPATSAEPTARFHTYVMLSEKDAVQDRLYMYKFH